MKFSAHFPHTDDASWIKLATTGTLGLSTQSDVNLLHTMNRLQQILIDKAEAETPVQLIQPWINPILF